MAADDRDMTRDEYVRQVRRLLVEGERLQARPSLAALRTWIAVSDELLRQAWGSMDRYHLSWLMVGRPADAVRGRAMTAAEEAGYVRQVAAAKSAALRMSLKAVEEDGMPFVGQEADRGQMAERADPRTIADPRPDVRISSWVGRKDAHRRLPRRPSRAGQPPPGDRAAG